MVVELSHMHDEQFTQMQRMGFSSQLTKLDKRFGSVGTMSRVGWIMSALFGAFMIGASVPPSCLGSRLPNRRWRSSAGPTAMPF